MITLTNDKGDKVSISMANDVTEYGEGEDKRYAVTVPMLLCSNEYFAKMMLHDLNTFVMEDCKIILNEGMVPDGKKVSKCAKSKGD